MEKIEYQRIEHRLLVLCSKINLSDSDKEEITSILNSQNLSIDYLIILAKKHKVLQLIAKNIMDLDRKSVISSPNKHFINSFYLYTKHKNNVLFDEISIVMSEFHHKGIKVVPLKGAILAPEVYKDFGLRILNDFDFLISIENRQLASNCLKSLGYSIGLFDWSTREIDAISREEELMWKMHVGNLYPHTKAIEDPYCKFISIDFSYDVDLQKDFTASNLLLGNSTPKELYGAKTYMLDEIDFLIHLCIHLYKEATNVQWVLYHADLNLIKFCDIREYTLKIYNDIDPIFFCERTKQLCAEEAVFYSYYYLDFIFGENFSNELLRDLSIKDKQYLEKYGTLDFDAPQKWKKSFYERFFALSNLDELTINSKLEEAKKQLK